MTFRRLHRRRSGQGLPFLAEEELVRLRKHTWSSLFRSPFPDPGKRRCRDCRAPWPSYSRPSLSDSRRSKRDRENPRFAQTRSEKRVPIRTFGAPGNEGWPFSSVQIFAFDTARSTYRWIPYQTAFLAEPDSAASLSSSFMVSLFKSPQFCCHRGDAVYRESAGETGRRSSDWLFAPENRALRRSSNR
jgi:hypothetical protein